MSVCDPSVRGKRSERYPRRRMSALYITQASCAAVGNALVVVFRAFVVVPRALVLTPGPR